MSSMKIGTKMVVALGIIAAVLTIVGGFFIYEQEQARLLTLLESQGKVIQAQVEVTRAYIAKNYVGKVKTSSVGSNIKVSREHGMDPQAIPFPATATRKSEKPWENRAYFKHD